MILLLLLFVSWDFTCGDKITLLMEQKESLLAAKAIVDVKNNVIGLIDELKAFELTKPTNGNEWTIPRAKEFIDALKKLAQDIQIPSAEAMEKDIFPDSSIVQNIMRLVALLETLGDEKLGKIIKECNPDTAITKCKMPFAPFEIEKHLPHLISARDTYVARDSEAKALEEVLNRLVKPSLKEQLAELKTKIEKEAGKETANLVPVADFDLSDNFAKELEDPEKYNPEIDYALNNTSDILKRVKKTIDTCQSAPINACKDMNDFPFAYTLTESPMTAFSNLVTNYRGRAPPAAPCPPCKCENTTDEPTDKGPETATNSPPTDTPDPKTPADTKNCCPVLCLAPLAPACPIINQCGCGRSTSSCNRGCRTQKNCCNCKDKCCDKEDKTPAKHQPVSSSSSPMIALVSAISLIASLRY